MTFVVERRMPNVNAADLAMLHEGLVVSCDVLRHPGAPFASGHKRRSCWWSPTGRRG